MVLRDIVKTSNFAETVRAPGYKINNRINESFESSDFTITLALGPQVSIRVLWQGCENGKMDKYLKCVKRQSTGDSKEPCGKTTSSKKQEDIRDFYFPESSRSDSSTNMTDHPIVPGAPQKPCDPDSAMMTALPEMADYWTSKCRLQYVIVRTQI